MKSGVMVLGWLQKAVLRLFVVAICLGIFLPVYSDEVGWRMQERAGFDGVDKLFSEICGSNTLAAPPFFMMPVRYYSAFFNGHFADPFYVRLSGVCYLLIWVLMLLTLIRRLAADSIDRVTLTALGVGLLGLGTMPLLMVWSRPEQPIVLAMTAALLVAWPKVEGGGEASAEVSSGTAWWRSIAILLLGVVIFSYHLKGLFLTPVLLTCLFFASRGRAANLPRLVVAALLIVMAGWSADYWIHRLQCPADAATAAEFARNNMGIELAGARNLPDFLSALGKIAGNISLRAYFVLPVPRADPMSHWLAYDQVDPRLTPRLTTVLSLTWYAALTLTAINCFVRGRTAWRERRLDARMIIALALLGSMMAWSATQMFRNVYEAPFVLPLVMMGLILSLSAREPGTDRRIVLAFRVYAGTVAAMAIASMAMIAALFGPSIARANEGTGYIAEQPYSLRVFGYSKLRPQIVAAARQCGIADPAKARALMIDDMTYFAMMRSKLPQHQLGVVGNWRGEIKDPIAYLRSRRSSGAILGCDYLPDDLRRRARQTGAFCCLAPPNW